MKFEFEMNQKLFKEQVIREVARQILREHKSRRMRLWGGKEDIEQTMQDKAGQLLKEDKKFDEEIKKDLKKQFKDKKLRASVVKEILKDKLEEED